MAKHFFWNELNASDFAALDPERTIAILPTASTEQHGPHLPLDVDLVCPVGVANGAGATLPAKILVLPVVAYG
nr:creatininase family protein [Pseudomonadota bacterium]